MGGKAKDKKQGTTQNDCNVAFSDRVNGQFLSDGSITHINRTLYAVEFHVVQNKRKQKNNKRK